jgi:protein-S-isoprenylcysteine O-methyltransferase Ste14
MLQGDAFSSRSLKVLDYLERLFVVLLSIPFVIAFVRVLPMHPSFILLTLSELISVVLRLTRRPGQIAATAYAFGIAIVGAALPLLIRPVGGSELVPALITTTLMFIGLALSIAAKVFLNRSFGLVAANRGVKRAGPYRIVRHPMYLGYIMTQLGFLLASFSIMNLALYVVTWVFQILRIREEERLLFGDAAYADYSNTVQHRLIPGVY